MRQGKFVAGWLVLAVFVVLLNIGLFLCAVAGALWLLREFGVIGLAFLAAAGLVS